MLATRRPFTRWQAAPIHLAISVLVALAAFAAIRFVWYPDPLFKGAGGLRLFLLIAGVDLTLGPLIPLIIYVPGKKGLRFDLAVIAVLQLAALAYGAWVLFESRPAWIVFTKDRFELVRANEIPDSERAKARAPFSDKPIDGPEVVAARVPADPAERTRIMFAALQGLDLQSFPQHYVPYGQAQAEALRAAKPFEALRALNRAQAAEIDALVRDAGLPENQLRFLPLRGGAVDLAMILDGRDGKVLRIAALKPWEY